jgi:hypothetical protein
VNKPLVLGAIAVVAVFAGVVYFAGREEGEVPADASSGSAGEPPGTVAEDALAAASGAAAPAASAPKKAVPADPRLAALAVSPDNGLIEFVTGADGKVIKELDKDPTSPGFRKTLREYTYRGDQVVGVVSHKYLGDQVQTTRTTVAYKPDGSIDQYRESVSYDYGEKGKPQD